MVFLGPVPWSQCSQIWRPPTSLALDTSLWAAQGCLNFYLLLFPQAQILYIPTHTFVSNPNKVTGSSSYIWGEFYLVPHLWWIYLFSSSGKVMPHKGQHWQCPMKMDIWCADLTMAGLWACVCSYMLWGIDSKKKQIGVGQVIPVGSLLSRHLWFKERHQLRWSMAQYQEIWRERWC